MKKTEVNEAMVDSVAWRENWQKREEMNFLQTEKWQEYSGKLGRKTVASWGETGGFLAIVREAKRGRYLEVPAGPIVDWDDFDKVKQIFEEIKEVGRREKCVFVRFRPQILENEENLTKMKKLGTRKALMHLAAENTVMIDLRASEEELLKNMRRQTRYEVKKAGKNGIVVWKGRSLAIFEIFFKIQAETAKRQGFIPPSKKELMNLREVFAEKAVMYVALAGEEGREEIFENKDEDFWTAERQEKIVAMGLVLDDGREAEYYEAASTDLNRKFPGAYALQWAAMRDLKARGILRYNLFGIAPAGHKNHRYSGVTTFKTGFGGEVMNYVPAQDLVIDRVRYGLVQAVEGARKKIRRL